MKTFFTSACFLFLLGTLQAQIVPHTRTLGGNVSAAIRSRDANNTEMNLSQIGVQPVFGKFLNKKWLLETTASYGYSSIKFTNNQISESDYNATNHSFGIGIGLTRAFPITESFYLTLGADVSAISVFNAFEDNNGAISRNQDVGIISGISPGLMYFISPRWIISGQFGSLRYQYFTRVGGNITDQFFGFQFSSFASSLGVRYVLAPRRKRGS